MPLSRLMSMFFTIWVSTVFPYSPLSHFSAFLILSSTSGGRILAADASAFSMLFLSFMRIIVPKHLVHYQRQEEIEEQNTEGNPQDEAEEVGSQVKKLEAASDEGLQDLNEKSQKGSRDQAYYDGPGRVCQYLELSVSPLSFPSPLHEMRKIHQGKEEGEAQGRIGQGVGYLVIAHSADRVYRYAYKGKQYYQGSRYHEEDHSCGPDTFLYR